MTTSPPVENRLTQVLAQLDVVSRNLMELSDAEVNRAIKVRLNDPARPYQGATLTAATTAFRNLEGLWEDYLLLARVVDKASELAKKNGLFRNDDEEILGLLNGPSVQLPAVHVPLPKRGLLMAAEQREHGSVDEVLEAMGKEFAEARDALAGIADAQAHARARLTAASEEAQTLARWGQSLGASVAFVQTVVQTIEHIEVDPLGCAQEADRLESNLAAQRTALQAIDAKREAVRVELDKARQTLGELKELVGRSRAALLETHEKIANVAGLVEPASDEAIASLEAWLHTLTENFNAGRWSAVGVGVLRWSEEYTTRLSVEQNAYSHNRAALDERNDLRGRFKALTAKADAYVQRGMALGETITALAAETDAALGARPFDLAAGRRLVGAYETALAAKTNHRSQ